MNLKDQKRIVVLNAPKEFKVHLDELVGVKVEKKFTESDGLSFLLAFATQLQQVAEVADKAARMKGDVLIWIAYPKGTSKKYTCEFNRDHGWASLGNAGFETVRQIAIDEDWTALRFRRVEYVSTMKRQSERTLSEVGKSRTQGNAASEKSVKKPVVRKVKRGKK